MSAWTIYWLTRLEPLGEMLDMLAFFLFVLGFAISVILGFGTYAEKSSGGKSEDESINAGIKCATRGIIWTMILACSSYAMSKLTPDRKDLAIIFAGSWATSNAEMQKLPENVVKTMNKFMDSYLEPEEEKKK
jgi:hypothetical protein